MVSKLPIPQDDLQAFRAIGEFTKLLNETPDEQHLKVNKLASTSKKTVKFIPIGVLENYLDEDFLGLWETYDYKQEGIANEITGSIVLRVFHPIAKQWIRRTGTASVMIQFTAGTEITDIRNKIKNTLVKDIPHLKSECIKNACKSLGKKYGRDLNRDDEALYENPVEEVSNPDALIILKSELSKIKTVTALKEKAGERQAFLDMGITESDFGKYFRERYEEIKEKK